MTWDTTSFDRSIKRMEKEVPKRVNYIVKKTAHEIYLDVKAETPVQTEIARAGWKSQKINDGKEISNDVPYVGYLEYGTRKMAPFGMLRKALARGSKRLQQRLNQLNNEMSRKF